jgi:hypothetical protein
MLIYVDEMQVTKLVAVSEGHILYELNSVFTNAASECILLLMSIYYVFNVSYLDYSRYTLSFLDYALLKKEPNNPGKLLKVCINWFKAVQK